MQSPVILLISDPRPLLPTRAPSGLFAGLQVTQTHLCRCGSFSLPRCPMASSLIAFRSQLQQPLPEAPD